jgi:hypothetical protein
LQSEIYQAIYQMTTAPGRRPVWRMTPSLGLRRAEQRQAARSKQVLLFTDLEHGQHISADRFGR